MSFLGDVVGGAAQVAAKPIDLLTGIDLTQAPAQGFSLQGLFSSVARPVVENSLAGVALGATSFWDQISDLDPAQAAMGAAFLGAGLAGGVSAHRMHAGRMAQFRGPAGLHLPDVAPDPMRGIEEMRRLGVPSPRIDPEFPTAALESVRRSIPGMRRETSWVLGGRDSVESARGLARWKADPAVDDERYARIGAALDLYGQKFDNTGDKLSYAQLSFAKAQTAFHLLGPASGPSKSQVPGTEQFRKLWGQLTTTPEKMKPEQLDELFTFVNQVDEATAGLSDPDLIFDPVVRITGFDFGDEGLTTYVYAPAWDDNVFKGGPDGDLVRMNRLKQLNYRALYEQGKDNLRSLFKQGQELANRGKLDRGEDWYPDYRRQTESMVYGFQPGRTGWTPDLERAVAAVSITSAGEPAATNIPKAERVLRVLADDPRVHETDFQLFLYGDAPVNTYNEWDPTPANTFYEIHRDLTADGVMVSEKDLLKILRLSMESGFDILAETGGPKQKSFYLNILKPELTDPVTIDRHAHDAFLGLESGVQKGPRLEPPTDVAGGEHAYDLISSAYREVAEELGIPSHSLQAVIWETWKIQKRQSGKGGWQRRDPYRLPTSDGGENQAFLAVQGLGGVRIEDLAQSIPMDKAPLIRRTQLSSGEPLQTARPPASVGTQVTPDGSIAVFGHVTDELASAVRHLYPEPAGADGGVARWLPGYVRSVQDVDELRSSFGRRATTTSKESTAGYVLETYDVDGLAVLGGHPAIVPGNHLTLEVPAEGLTAARAELSKVGEVRRVQGVEVDEPALSRRPVTVEEIDEKTFLDPENGPLATSSWATLSAGLNGDQIKRWGLKGYDADRAHQKLGAELRRQGFVPIEADGLYFGEPEKGWLVFGIRPTQARQLGEKFYQDSVLTNAGLVYGKTANDPAMAGKLVESSGLVPGGSGAGRTRVKLRDGNTYDFAADFPDESTNWDGVDIEDADQIFSQRTSRRTVKLAVSGDRDALLRTADAVKAAGARNQALYLHSTSPAGGWVAARESLFTDGNRVMAHRSLTNDLVSPNGFRVFLRPDEAVALPRGTDSVNRHVRDISSVKALDEGELLVNGEVAVMADRSLGGLEAQGSFDQFKVAGKRVRFANVILGGPLPTVIVGRSQAEVAGIPGVMVELTGKSAKIRLSKADELPAFRALDVMRRLGYAPERLTLQLGDETVRVADIAAGLGTTVDPTVAMQSVDTGAGPISVRERDPLFLKPARSTNQRVSDVADRFLIRNAVGWDTAPDYVVSGMESAFDHVESLLPGRIGEWRMDVIEYAPIDKLNEPDFLAQVDMSPMSDGRRKAPARMLVNKALFTDEAPVIRKRILGLRTKGILVPAGDPVRYVFLHELGHVMHSLVQQRHGSKADFLNWSVYHFQDNQVKVARELSAYAAKDSREMVAEAFAEVMGLGDAARPMARQIYERMAKWL